MKRKAQEIEMPTGDILKITPLGAGNEVGRSCIMLEFMEKIIMVCVSLSISLSLYVCVVRLDQCSCCVLDPTALQYHPRLLLSCFSSSIHHNKLIVLLSSSCCVLCTDH
jgi:hypothetical protein